MSDDDCPCYECDRVRDAHRTAIELVLAHLESYDSMVASGVPGQGILTSIRSNIAAMRDWTPEHAAEVLRETKNK